MSTTTRVWVNGDLVDPTGPSVSALDHSVTVGDGVFETAKIAAGQPFALTRHHRRLERSAAGLGLPALDLALVDKGVAAVLDGPADRLRPAALQRHRRHRAARDPTGSDASLTYIVVAAPQPRPPVEREAHRRPVDPQRALRRRRPEDDVVRRERRRPRPRQGAGRHRGGLRQHPRRALRVHRQQHLRRRRRRRADAAGWTRAAASASPASSPSSGAAPAASRCARRPCRSTVLGSADEVFITSSTKDVLPIHAVDDRTLPSDRPVTTELQRGLPEQRRAGLRPVTEREPRRRPADPARCPAPVDYSDRNATLDAGEDRWAWRARLRRNRLTHAIWRTAVGVVGGLVTIAGLIMVPAPGPGWLVVFFGLLILASEFEFAQQLARLRQAAGGPVERLDHGSGDLGARRRRARHPAHRVGGHLGLPRVGRDPAVRAAVGRAAADAGPGDRLTPLVLHRSHGEGPITATTPAPAIVPTVTPTACRHRGARTCSSVG